jgi:hypothetical protein
MKNSCGTYVLLAGIAVYTAARSDECANIRSVNGAAICFALRLRARGRVSPVPWQTPSKLLSITECERFFIWVGPSCDVNPSGIIP